MGRICGELMKQQFPNGVVEGSSITPAVYAAIGALLFYFILLYYFSIGFFNFFPSCKLIINKYKKALLRSFVVRHIHLPVL